METMCIEDLVSVTGSSYRTVKKYLDEAGIEPVGTSGKSILYKAGPALRVLIRREPQVAKAMDYDEKFVGTTLFPALFSEGSAFTKMLVDQLESSGMKPAQVLKVCQVAALGFICFTNDFFGYDAVACNDGGGISFGIPDLMKSISAYGSGDVSMIEYE